MTIAAISTPNGPGGIAVIRISGDDSLLIADKIFKSVTGKKAVQIDGYTCAYGAVYDKDERIDNCILTVFKAPHSYTGENIAEISCHGGLYVTKRILRAVLKNGAVPAEPGEFTKRAFLNGKIDLTQAEAVMDVISSNSELSLRMAENIKNGAIYNKIQIIKRKIVSILGDLAAWADYPDEDIPAVNPDHLKQSLYEVETELSSLVEGYDYGRILREGVDTVIVGRPNVGKSTLFNRLNGYERSIVTDIAGTTRDIIEETVSAGDIVLRLSDTAGIRATDDIIEGIGVEMTYKKTEMASLVIAVFDGSCPLTADDFVLLEKLRGRRAIAVINKSDAPQLIDAERIKSEIIQTVYVSAKNNTGINSIINCIEKIFYTDCFDNNSVLAANERQKNCIDMALKHIKEAIDALIDGVFLDAITVIIDDAVSCLMELTGEKVIDSVVDEVFSRFCVGK